MCPPSPIEKLIVGDGSARHRTARRYHGRRAPDLVADIAVCRHPVSADNDEVDHPALHQMATGIVGNHRMLRPWWCRSPHLESTRRRRVGRPSGLGNSAIPRLPAPACRSMGTGCLSGKWAAPIEIIIPSAMANTVRTTNFKVIALWVIAETRFDLPHA